MAISAGINIFSVHKELGEDYFGTLGKLAAAGYENLELIGFNMKTFTRYIDEIPVETMKKKLREMGLKSISVHEGTIPGQDLVSHDWDSILAYYEFLECRNIVLPSVWVYNQEDTLRAAEQLNIVGKRLKESGFNFYLHNHAHEFKRIGEKTLFDLLLENTESSNVKFELDLAWVMRAGLDPLAVLNRLGNRCDIIHQKDLNPRLGTSLNILEAMQQGGDEDLEGFLSYQKYTSPDDCVDLGTGMFDFKTTYQRVKEMGHIRYTFVENEGDTPDKLHSIENDLKVLRQYL